MGRRWTGERMVRGAGGPVKGQPRSPIGPGPGRRIGERPAGRGREMGAAMSLVQVTCGGTAASPSGTGAGSSATTESRCRTGDARWRRARSSASTSGSTWFASRSARKAGRRRSTGLPSKAATRTRPRRGRWVFGWPSSSRARSRHRPRRPRRALHPARRPRPRRTRRVTRGRTSRTTSARSPTLRTGDDWPGNAEPEPALDLRLRESSCRRSRRSGRPPHSVRRRWSWTMRETGSHWMGPDEIFSFHPNRDVSVSYGAFCPSGSSENRRKFDGRVPNVGDKILGPSRGGPRSGPSGQREPISSSPGSLEHNLLGVTGRRPSSESIANRE